MPDPAAEDPRPVGRRTPVVGGAFVLSALLALAGTTLILGLGAAAEPPPRHILAVVTFLLDLTLVTAVVCGFGYAVTGYASGIAMSSWNDYSLSKLQMALWTIVVVSGLLTIIKIRLLGHFGTVAQPLDIEIPGELLAAMGIAAFTTAMVPANFDNEVEPAARSRPRRGGPATGCGSDRSAAFRRDRRRKGDRPHQPRRRELARHRYRR